MLCSQKEKRSAGSEGEERYIHVTNIMFFTWMREFFEVPISAVKYARWINWKQLMYGNKDWRKNNRIDYLNLIGYFDQSKRIINRP